jgi:hypothetical protein
MRKYFFTAKVCSRASLFFVIFLSGYSFSCTRSAPTIAFSTMSLNYIEEDTGPIPTLSFFVLASDEDGYEDLAELRLYHDQDGLLWTFTTNNWMRYDEAGNTWLGSRRIAMAGGEGFPSGQYRAVLIDKAGERTERVFGFDVPAIPRYPFPKLNITDESYTITSEYPESYFICYGSDGAYRRHIKTESKTGNLSALRLSPDILSVALWAYDAEHSTSALTKPAAVH